MMEIKILGTGCAKCKQVKRLAAEVVSELQLDAVIIEVTDAPSILAYGVMSTPAIVIDEEVVGYGGGPSKTQMMELVRRNNS
jgi:small redox-active disulfide protein 2